MVLGRKFHIESEFEVKFPDSGVQGPKFRKSDLENYVFLFVSCFFVFPVNCSPPSVHDEGLAEICEAEVLAGLFAISGYSGKASGRFFGHF